MNMYIKTFTVKGLLYLINNQFDKMRPKKKFSGKTHCKKSRFLGRRETIKRLEKTVKFFITNRKVLRTF